MFAKVKQKRNPDKEQAKRLYAACLKHSRQPYFYQDYKVPDSFDGRFDLLVLHIFLIIHRLGPKEAAYNQTLFDVMFADMDQTLREKGIGDMGVPKHMKRMMLAFNGRMHAYEDGIKNDTLKEALKRNLYGTVSKVKEETLDNMTAYIQKTLKELKDKNNEAVKNGEAVFN